MGGSWYRASGSRLDLGGCLGWPQDSFRKVLAHPKLAPYLLKILGPGYRLDHQPFVILQEKDSEGFSLHGGPMEKSPDDDELDQPSSDLMYRCQNGHMWTSLLAVSIALAPVNPGDGGFCVVKGSHKMNFALPKHLANGESTAFNEECVTTVGAGRIQPGDVILFSEATVHGALPWRAEHERRIALYRFAPCNVVYARSYLGEREDCSSSPYLSSEANLRSLPFGIPDRIWDEMPLQEKCILEPAFGNRVERLRVASAEDGIHTTHSSRSEVKKEHDKFVYGTEWF